MDNLHARTTASKNAKPRTHAMVKTVFDLAFVIYDKAPAEMRPAQ
jgi:hypothetical protein